MNYNPKKHFLRYTQRKKEYQWISMNCNLKKPNLLYS